MRIKRRSIIQMLKSYLIYKKGTFFYTHCLEPAGCENKLLQPVPLSLYYPYL
jgi:hypothetical protein